MRRREFISLLGASMLPVPAFAQQAAVPVIGFLSSAAQGRDAGRLRAFRQGLNQAGFIEGRNVAFEYRWAEEHLDRLPGLVTELVNRQVNIIMASGHVRGVLAAQAATKTIPIVFLTGSDPVATGLVASLGRPGSNLTGMATLGIEMEPKLLELLHEVVPAVTEFGALINPDNPNAKAQARGLEAAASKMGVKIDIVHAAGAGEFENAFAKLANLKAGGLVIVTDGIFISGSEELAALALRQNIPAIFQYRTFTEAGGLMSYGANIAELFRQCGIYAARILKGEKPADLPVQQATRVEFVINLKTARGLGVTVPLPLIGRADEVIE